MVIHYHLKGLAMLSHNNAKVLLHNELKLRYREFFESRLANEFIQNPAVFTAVGKMSDAILHLMNTHKDCVMKTLSAEKKINDGLYGKTYFGRLTTTATCPDDMYRDICNTLKQPGTQFAEVMQVHNIFIHRIYKSILKKENKLSELKLLEESFLRKSIDSSREEQKSFSQASTQPGVCKNPVFMRMFKQHSHSHIRGMDRFFPDPTSAYAKN